MLDKLAFVESARWHEGRLWFAHWSVGEIIATDIEGYSQVMAPGRHALGWSIEWLPDGRLLVTGESLLRQEPDGSFVQHADLALWRGTTLGYGVTHISDDTRPGHHAHRRRRRCSDLVVG